MRGGRREMRGGRGRGGGGRREKRGLEEGEERKIGRDGERGKFCASEARAAPRREEGDKGREGEVRGGRGRGLPPVRPLNNDPTSPKGPRKQTTEPILGTALLEKKNPVTTG